MYTWGQGIDQSLLDDGDDLNDETFGALGDIGKSALADRGVMLKG